MGIPPPGYVEEGTDRTWANEYRQGGEYEIYRVPLSSVFGGCTFSAAARIIYEETAGVVLFAVDIMDSSLDEPIVAVCPTNMVIPASQNVLVHAYCLARDKREADIAASIAPLEHLSGRNSRGKVRRKASISDLFPTPTTPQAKADGSSSSPVAGGSSQPGTPGTTPTTPGSSDEAFKRALRDWIHGEKRKSRGQPGRGGPAAAVELKLHHKLRLAKSQVQHARKKLKADRRARRLAKHNQAADKTGNSSKNRDAEHGRCMPRSLSAAAPEGPKHSRLSEVLPRQSSATYASEEEDRLQKQSISKAESPDEFHRRVVQAARKRKRTLLRLLENTTDGSDMVRPLETAMIQNAANPGNARPSIRNHILIVCSDAARNLYHLVKPLRATHLVDHLPIVVMSPVPIPSHTWGPASRFQDVFVVRGSPMAKHDLLRAGVKEALAVVLLASRRGVGSSAPARSDGATSARGAAAGADVAPSGEAGPSASGGYLVDSDVICAYRLIRDLVPDREAVVEISQQDNIQFLSTSGLDGSSGTLLSAPFVAGHCFTPSFLDVLMSQAFYNRHVVSILNSLVAGGDDRQLRSWSKG